MQTIGATGDWKSAVATPDGKKPKEEEEEEEFNPIIHLRGFTAEQYLIGNSYCQKKPRITLRTLIETT